MVPSSERRTCTCVRSTCGSGGNGNAPRNACHSSLAHGSWGVGSASARPDRECAKRKWRSPPRNAREPTVARLGAPSPSGAPRQRHSSNNSGRPTNSAANASKAATACLHGSSQSGHVQLTISSPPSGVNCVSWVRSDSIAPGGRGTIPTAVTTWYGSSRLPTTVAISWPGESSSRVTAPSATYSLPRRNRGGSAIPATATDNSVLASRPTGCGSPRN